MNAKTGIKAILLSVLLLPALAVADYSKTTGTFEETIALDGAVLLDVDTGAGSIDVSAGSGGEASIVGKIKVRRESFWRKSPDADAIIKEVQDNPPIQLSDGRLRVGYFKDKSLGKKVSISYEITVPADTEVIADTGSGSITITDIAAPVSADTGSGSVKLENIGGPAKADTGSGSVKANGVAGSFEADTGSGSVYLMQTAPGDVEIDTGSGSAELKGVVGALHVDTGSGRVVVDGRQEGPWDIDTGSGSVRITLPDDAAFTLNAEASSGGITVNHPIEVQGKISKRHIRGDVRGGGPVLKVDTGSGSIKID